MLRSLQNVSRRSAVVSATSLTARRQYSHKLIKFGTDGRAELAKGVELLGMMVNKCV